MRFVIVASPRTGSSHLVNTLSGHPEIFCNGNALHAQHLWLFWPKADLAAAKGELCDLRKKDPEAFVERIFNTGYGRAHVGFKIFDGQNNMMLRRILDARAIRKIVLYRKNVLANYSSALIAREIRRWGAMEGENPPPTPKVLFDEKGFITFHDEYIGFYRKVLNRLQKKRQKFHLIEYGEINDPLLFGALINFIGADPMKSISKSDQFRRQIKLNSVDIVSRFSNPEQLENYLRQSNLLHWMYEGEGTFALMGNDNVKTLAKRNVAA